MNIPHKIPINLIYKIENIKIGLKYPPSPGLKNALKAFRKSNLRICILSELKFTILRWKSAAYEHHSFLSNRKISSTREVCWLFGEGLLKEGIGLIL